MQFLKKRTSIHGDPSCTTFFSKYSLKILFAYRLLQFLAFLKKKTKVDFTVLHALKMTVNYPKQKKK